MISVFNGRSRGLGTGGGEDVHVQVSVALRKHLHLFKGAKLGVFMAIALHSDKDGWSYPPTELLAKETGLNRDTVFSALDQLCELQIDGHRVLLRRKHRRKGEFSNNWYLIFPTPEEISKYETPELFSTGKVTKSEKADTVKSRHGKKPSREKPVSGKSDPNKRPGSELDPHAAASSTEASQKQEPNTHTQLELSANERAGPNEKAVCVKSKFSLDQLRTYAWASHHYDQWLKAREPGRKIDGIRNPEGWAIAAQRTGQCDEIVQGFVDNPGMFDHGR